MKFLFLFILLIYSLFTSSQEWSEPVNVSNLAGIDYQPKIAVDHSGNIHCVWVHQYSSFFWKIFYSKSVDNGQTWESPQDVSMNDSICISGPNIVTDSQNKVYVSYDYDIYNPAKTLILLKSFDGNAWSDADTISDNLYASWNNKLVIDHYDKLYCFWYRNMYSGTMYYRTSEDGINWSEVYIPYPNDIIFPVTLTIDEENNLQIMGTHRNEIYGYGSYVYFKYELLTSLWSDLEYISGLTSGGGADIDCDNNNHPHLVWRQNTPGTGQSNDSTLYRYFDGNNWLEPVLIVEDPFSQKIEILNNKIYILDLEKDGDSSNIVFYEKDENENWIGKILIHNDNTNPNDFLASINELHLILRVNQTGNNLEIFYMNRIIDTTTQIGNNEFYLKPVHIYPNPFNQYVRIQYEIMRYGNVCVKVFDLSGNLINTLINKPMISGRHWLDWDGTNESGIKVKSGIYLIRVQAENNVITRSVEFLK